MATCRSRDKKLYDNTTVGGGASKLSESFGIALAKARSILKMYFLAFPYLRAYFDAQGVTAKANGYVLCNPVSGRRSYIPF